MNIKLNIDIKDIDFQKVDPETGKSMFLDAEDIASMTPRVKDYRYFGIHIKHKFSFTINILLDYAR